MLIVGPMLGARDWLGVLEYNGLCVCVGVLLGRAVCVAVGAGVCDVGVGDGVGDDGVIGIMNGGVEGV